MLSQLGMICRAFPLCLDCVVLAWSNCVAISVVSLTGFEAAGSDMPRPPPLPLDSSLSTLKSMVLPTVGSYRRVCPYGIAYRRA